ncbi:hypothetical protein QZH41_015145 [Actinostola sp. cb2023]|nr:hypothetical protein QZH41_015145 [Actinostola sp. cb2023]
MRKLQFEALVFAVGTPGFHCVTANVTCPSKQCCDECTSYVFDGPFTSAVSEWNLICDRAYLGATVQSCYFAGMLIGSFTTGMMSDAWGRKNCIFFCNAIMVRQSEFVSVCTDKKIAFQRVCVKYFSSIRLLLQLVAGVASAFVDCISFFAFLRFVVGFGLTGVMLTLFIYGMELVGPKHRTAAGNLTYFYYNVSSLLFTLIAYFIRDWRILLLVTTAPALLLFPCWKWMPESPRWLVAHNRLDEALDAIKKYGGKDDDNPVDLELLKNLLEEVRHEQEAKQKGDKKYTSFDLFRTPKMRKWTLIVCYQWFAVALVSFGIVFFLTQLAGNIYLNITIMQIASLLRVALAWIIFLNQCDIMYFFLSFLRQVWSSNISWCYHHNSGSLSASCVGCLQRFMFL